MGSTKIESADILKKEVVTLFNGKKLQASSKPLNRVPKPLQVSNQSKAVESLVATKYFEHPQSDALGVAERYLFGALELISKAYSKPLNGGWSVDWSDDFNDRTGNSLIAKAVANPMYETDGGDVYTVLVSRNACAQSLENDPTGGEIWCAMLSVGIDVLGLLYGFKTVSRKGHYHNGTWGYFVEMFGLMKLNYTENAKGKLKPQVDDKSGQTAYLSDTGKKAQPQGLDVSLLGRQTVKNAPEKEPKAKSSFAVQCPDYSQESHPFKGNFASGLVATWFGDTDKFGSSEVVQCGKACGKAWVLANAEDLDKLMDWCDNAPEPTESEE